MHQDHLVDAGPELMERLRQPTEAEDCRIDAGMVRNLLQAMDGKEIRYAALMTGAEHCMGTFEAYAKAKMVVPDCEEQPRLLCQNFYRDQEDELFAAAVGQGLAMALP